MATRSFLNCLAEGRAFEEDCIAELVARGGILIHRPTGNFKAYDFSMAFNGKEYRFECKCDNVSCRTNQVAIEFSCSGARSGITATEADFWIIRACKTAYIIRASAIMNYINRREYVGVRSTKNSRLFIFDIPVLMKKAVLFKEY